MLQLPPHVPVVVSVSHQLAFKEEDRDLGKGGGPSALPKGTESAQGGGALLGFTDVGKRKT